ncbi:MAG TPA: GntR family transcriptional regulator [Chloroflexota bacterium]|nr:GntR family transcriptional regulator [Chloroflexota bacterium]
MTDSLIPGAVGPKYMRLASLIRAKIERGEWPLGMLAPSERELCGTYELSRMTVRQALSELVREGLLVSMHGKGTFVARPPLRQSLSQLTGFSEDMRDRGMIATTRLLKVEKQMASPEMALALALPEGAPVLNLQRLRLANGHPLTIETSTLRGDISAPLLDEDLERQSLYRLLEERCGVRLTRAGQQLEASVADATEAALLNIAQGAAILHIKRTTYALWERQEVPVEFVCSTYRGDRYRFFVELRR